MTDTALTPDAAQIPRSMKALTRVAYGPPGVVRVSELPVPVPKDDEVLVRVRASTVNSADWRIRAGAFPGILALPARLMFGIRKPRNPRLGSEFAGTVVAVGLGVTRFTPGDRVHGIVSTGGATAQYLAVPETGALAAMPQGLAFAEAAALPFGGLCALAFLSDFAGLSRGQRLLVVGASGGVGIHAVQIGKAHGAHVTGVTSGANQSFVTGLGADATIDYTALPVPDWPPGFDVILDTIGTVAPFAARRLLVDGGVFLPLNFGLREIGAALLNPMRRRKIRIAVNEDTAECLAELSRLVETGRLRPVAGHRFALDQAQEAHALVESRHRRGSVVIEIE